MVVNYSLSIAFNVLSFSLFKEKNTLIQVIAKYRNDLNVHTQGL